MTVRPDFSVLRVRTETFNAVKAEAERKGQKLWFITDLALNEYLQNERRL